MTTSGKIAYVSQQAWIINDTLRNNILMGDPLDMQRYQRVLSLCELDSDINQFPGRDLIEIGERGINLSGGQKQRVSLARAVYARGDIYVLDDPLSAVDQYVGRKLFENVIHGELKSKCVVFVTNQLQFLKECDRVAVMKHGRIVEVDRYDALMARSDSELAKLMSSRTEDADELEKSTEELSM